MILVLLMAKFVFIKKSLVLLFYPALITEVLGAGIRGIDLKRLALGLSKVSVFLNDFSPSQE